MTTVIRRPFSAMRWGCVTCALTLGIASCSSDRSPAGAAPTSAAVAGDATPASASAARDPLGPIPEPLDALEAAAEDVFDQIPAGRWDAIGRDVEDMATAWTGFRDLATAADSVQAGRLENALGALGEAASRRNGPASAQAANDVSRPVIELSAHYDLPHPVQIGRLDVIGRQILLDVDRGDLAAASSSLDAARAEWSSLGADVLDHGGADVATRTDSSLDAVAASLTTNDPDAVTHEVGVLLELVDELERLS